MEKKKQKRFKQDDESDVGDESNESFDSNLKLEKTQEVKGNNQDDNTQ